MSVIYATVLSKIIIPDRSAKKPTAYPLILSNKPKTPKVSLDMRRHLIGAGVGDNGIIIGKVTEQSMPVVRRVMCYHRMSRVLVTSTWSDSGGDYQLIGLIAGIKYYVTSLDENGDAVQYNAVTQDLITASEVTV